MKFTFDPIYTVKGWFSRLLSAAGWFDAELSDADAAVGAVEGNITVARGLASSDAVGQVVHVAGNITVTRGLASEDIVAESQEEVVEQPDEEIGSGFGRPRRRPAPRPIKPIPVLVGQIFVSRPLALSLSHCMCGRRRVSGVSVNERPMASNQSTAVVDNDEQWIIAVA